MPTKPASSGSDRRSKTTIRSLQAKKQQGVKISMLTAYDFPTALILEQVGIDVILVGDSLGMVVLGYPNTLAVTMEDMLHHCRAVGRGAHTPLLVGDMPFLSYQVSVAEAVCNAGRFLQEAGMDAVKLEGGRERLDAVRAIAAAGIPVMGHLGLTPQQVHQFGGFHPQALTAEAARELLLDAQALQDAGIFSLVLEVVPARLAEMVSQHLEIPIIGIGAGSGCDGQVLVTNDLLGLYQRFRPRFVQQYASLGAVMYQAFERYIQDIHSGAFPAAEHSIEMPEAEWDLFLQGLGDE